MILESTSKMHDPIKLSGSHSSGTILQSFPISKRFILPNHYIISKPIRSPKKYMLSSDDIDYHISIKSLISLKNFENLLNFFENSTKFDSPLSKESALSSFPLPHNTTSIVYQYWITKRSILKHSLCRSYWGGFETTDENLKKVFGWMKSDKMKLRKKKKRETETLLEVIFKQKQKIYCKLLDFYNIIVWISRKELLKLHLQKINKLEFECKVANLGNFEFFSDEVLEVFRNSIVKESRQYRNLKTYSNHYSKFPPKLKFD